MATPSDQRFTALAARQLVRAGAQACLSSLRPDGSPYGSLVSYATTLSGAPLLLVSKLAWHTRHLEVDGRACLLVTGELPQPDALAGARVSLMGHFRPVAREAAAERYLARHPEASVYANFADFSFWEMEVTECHAVAGFGRIETFPGDNLLLNPADMARFTQETEGATQHMNEDHSEAVALYAEKLLGQGKGAWRMAAMDPDGADLSCEGKAARLAFPEPVFDGHNLRKMLAKLAAQAREMPSI